MSASQATRRATAKPTPHDNPYANAKSGLEQGERDLFSYSDKKSARNAEQPSSAKQGRSPTLELTTSDQFLTDRDVAQRYKVQKQTIWRWAKTSSTFPKPFKIEGTTRWSRNELDEHDRKIKETR